MHLYMQPDLRERMGQAHDRRMMQQIVDELHLAKVRQLGQ